MKGFFAHTAHEASCETISNAIKIINDTGNVEVKSWLDLQIAGKYIIDVVCEEIKKSELFLADLTYLNHNVLFELGYAIALNKRIVIFIDTSISTASVLIV